MLFRVTNFINNKSADNPYKFYLAKEIYKDGSHSRNEFKIYTDLELKLYETVYNTNDFKDVTIIPKSLVIK